MLVATTVCFRLTNLVKLRYLFLPLYTHTEGGADNFAVVCRVRYTGGARSLPSKGSKKVFFFVVEAERVSGRVGGVRRWAPFKHSNFYGVNTHLYEFFL